MSLNALAQHGAFSWNELMTSDIEGARKFYSELFGWTLKEMENSEMPYTIVSVDGKDIAGMMPSPSEANQMPPLWGGYVTVDDVDSSVKKATALGGKVFVEPRDIPEVGRYAVISDPQGAMISMITYVDSIKQSAK